jgi:hypothetical protein
LLVFGRYYLDAVKFGNLQDLEEEDFVMWTSTPAQINLPFSLSTSIGCVAKSFLFCPKLDIAEHTTNGI